MLFITNLQAKHETQISSELNVLRTVNFSKIMAMI